MVDFGPLDDARATVLERRAVQHARERVALGPRLLHQLALVPLGGVAERDDGVHRTVLAVEHERVIDLVPAEPPRVEVPHAQHDAPARHARLHVAVQRPVQLHVLRRDHAGGDGAVGHVHHARGRRQVALHRALHGERAVGQVERGDVLAAHLRGDAKRVLAHAQALGGVHPRADVQHEAGDRAAPRVVTAPRHRPQQRAGCRLLVHLDLEVRLACLDMRAQLAAERAPTVRVPHVEGVEIVGGSTLVAQQAEELVVGVQRLDRARLVSHAGHPCGDFGFVDRIKKQFAHKSSIPPPQATGATTTLTCERRLTPAPAARASGVARPAAAGGRPRLRRPHAPIRPRWWPAASRAGTA